VAIPYWLVDACLTIVIPGHDKQGIREAVQVWQHMSPYGLVTGQRDNLALGPTANGARYVQVGRGRRAPGQDEVLERRELTVQAVDEFLESPHVSRLDPWAGTLCLLRLRDAQLGAEVKELVLYSPQGLNQLGAGMNREHDSELSVELVYGAVRADAQRILRYTLTRAQAGRSVVPGSRVDLRDAGHECPFRRHGSRAD
jgi:hypothetical protein